MMHKLETIGAYEFFYSYDDGGDVYEIFLDESGETYIGCCASLAQARRFIVRWLKEQR